MRAFLAATERGYNCSSLTADGGLTRRRPELRLTLSSLSLSESDSSRPAVARSASAMAFSIFTRAAFLIDETNKKEAVAATLRAGCGGGGCGGSQGLIAQIELFGTAWYRNVGWSKEGAYFCRVHMLAGVEGIGVPV